MFEFLLSDWGMLTHAYGNASDVPEQIRALASADPAVREDALWKLYCNIFHQGTRYTASPHAVPLLEELILNQEVPARDQIVYLLVNLALGYEESYLPDGIDRERFVGELKRAGSRLSMANREYCREYGVGPAVDLECYLAVEKCCPAFLRLLDDENVEVRRAGAYALAWFPKFREECLPALTNVMRTATDAAEIAGAILAVGLLCREVHELTPLIEIESYLQHSSFLVRVASAIAIAYAPLPQHVLNVLVEGLAATDEMQGVTGIAFNEGNLVGYIGMTIARFAVTERDTVIPVLCEALPKVSPWGSLDVTRAILDLIFCNDLHSQRPTEFREFDPTEAYGLQMIAAYGAWEKIGNYAQLVRAYGLPDSRAALLEYLQ